jgi:hypothetical protein
MKTRAMKSRCWIGKKFIAQYAVVVIMCYVKHHVTLKAFLI